MKLLAGLIGLLGAGAIYDRSTVAKKRIRENRQCLSTGCTKMHNHNNAYCSAECCKAHRAEMKSEK